MLCGDHLLGVTDQPSFSPFTRCFFMFSSTAVLLPKDWENWDSLLHGNSLWGSCLLPRHAHHHLKRNLMGVRDSVLPKNYCLHPDCPESLEKVFDPLQAPLHPPSVFSPQGCRLRMPIACSLCWGGLGRRRLSPSTNTCRHGCPAPYASEHSYTQNGTTPYT